LKPHHSFLLSAPSDAAFIESIETPEWKLTTHEDPSRRFWASEDGKGFCEYRLPEFATETSDMIACREIVIHAPNAQAAENIQQLIYGGILLGYPDIHNNRSPHSSFAVGDLAPELLKTSPFCGYFARSDNAEYGCRLAQAAWANRRYIYAIEKLKLSWRLDWFTPHSASPRHGQIFDNEHPEFSYHTEAAFAVIAAFSAIEELGLEVTSSAKNPRFVGDDKNEWNPEVRENLEKRLSDAGADLTESFLWVHRGNSTAVEDELKPKLGDDAPYADDYVVRDRELDLIDAIHYTSWLRNFVAAHKFSELTKAISPYDVYNVQGIARRLILTSLGFWRVP
jgi:hypothetical protein